MNLKITILSGGSGNDALIKGLKQIYEDCEIKVIVNAYDNGKSTGVCRKLTNTLGVSDIRKNHIRLYKTINPHIDERLIEFYEGRYNFTTNVKEEVLTLLDKWNLSELSKYVIEFFSNPESLNYSYNNFNVSNIIYSQMYKDLGYEVTNKYFCNLLNLEDFVILNSFDNVFIRAITNNNNVIEDEGQIVEYCNSEDKIKDIKYIGEVEYNLNPKAVEAIQYADMLIISTGTFWSSIYPTLQYGDLYKCINSSKAKKIWVINNEEDKDAYGVSSNDFIDIVERLGLDLKDFLILENLDASEILRQQNDKYNIKFYAMDNIDGKHNSNKYVKALLKTYYNIENINNYDYILLDFDDTLWSRDTSNDKLLSVSRDNIKLLNFISNKAMIISGNSYESIYSKISQIYGSELHEFNVPIWAEANSIEYIHNIKYDKIEELSLNDGVNLITDYLKDNYSIDVEYNKESDFIPYLKIKPLTNLERTLLCNLLNNYVFKELKLNDYKALITGTTTLDITKTYNSKSKVFEHLNLEGKKTLYIGDEIDEGNDKDIAKLCTSAIHTTGAQETNIILKLLEEV